MKKVIWVFLALVLTTGMVFAAAGQQQAASGSALGNYPSKPIRCIVPFAPGGGTDAFVRTVMKYLKLPQSVAVVNIEGATGLVGAMEGYHSPNDGYTIIAHMPINLLGMTLSGQAQIELWKELEPICWAVTDYEGTFTNKQSGFKSIEEVVAYAKAHPGELKWGVVGARSLTMVMALRIIEGLGLKGLVTIVPYDGGSEIRTALMGNHIQLSNNSLGDFSSVIQSGDALPLIVISETRTNLSPNTPTTVEKGLKDITTLVPRGFFAPPGTNPAQLRYLEAAFKLVIENPEFVTELSKFNTDAFFVPGLEGRKRVEEAYKILKPYYDNF